MSKPKLLRPRKISVDAQRECLSGPVDEMIKGGLRSSRAFGDPVGHALRCEIERVVKLLQPPLARRLVDRASNRRLLPSSNIRDRKRSFSPKFAICPPDAHGVLVILGLSPANGRFSEKQRPPGRGLCPEATRLALRAYYVSVCGPTFPSCGLTMGRFAVGATVNGAVAISQATPSCVRALSYASASTGDDPFVVRSRGIEILLIQIKDGRHP